MPCPDISVIQSAACASGIWEVSDEIELLKLIAQSALDWAEANNEGVNYSLAAVQDRMCDSGIMKVDSEIMLYGLIAGNLCNTIT